MTVFNPVLFFFYTYSLAPKLYEIPGQSDTATELKAIKHKSLIFKAATQYEKHTTRDGILCRMMMFLIILCLIFGIV